MARKTSFDSSASRGGSSRHPLFRLQAGIQGLDKRHGFDTLVHYWYDDHCDRLATQSLRREFHPCLPTLATRSWPMTASASTTASFDAYGGRSSAARILCPEKTTITARSGFACGSRSSRLSSVSTSAAMP